MEAHKQLSEELETILDAIINPEYGDLPEYLRDAIM